VNRRRLLLAGALVLIAVGAGVYAYVHHQLEPTKKRGSAKEEFTASQPPPPKPTQLLPWPTYGFNRERTHTATFKHRPPYRRVWSVDGRDTLEFPPSVGYGHVYLAQQKGLFFAIDAQTGRVEWRKRTHRCSASSPALGRELVYQAWMDFVPCPQSRPGATGYLSAMDPKTGHERWRFRGAPIESSPLLVRRRLYFGSWDHRVHAIDARNGHRIWSFHADDEVNTSPAYWRGTIYIASDGGSVYALSAKTGRMRWHSQSNAKFGSREFFYATPTVAHGRVYIGNTDGTMYVYGARTGKLRWARPLGTYIYSAAAVWRNSVYTGTYDGAFYSLDAATGDVRWKRTAPGAVHGAPTVMDGVVYYSTCSTCGSAASRGVKRGPDRTIALNARTGHRLWKFGAGKYANPVVADEDRIYVTGRAKLFALTEPSKVRAARRKVRAARRAAARARGRRGRTRRHPRR
jgi:outer membrane protein assembly factor BamB